VLHKVNLPTHKQYLEWVVQLQSDLLHELCKATTTDADITADWVQAIRSDIDLNWVNKFCNWSIKSRSILDRMGAIASLPSDKKTKVIAHYGRNIRFVEVFDNTIASPALAKSLPDDLSDQACDAYKDFFEMFYDPIFYKSKGYSINATELNGDPFHKDVYLETYRNVNPTIKVCPLCDGDMDGAELDHWLAKKHLPELNCHPQNLIEICGACNSRTNKGEKPALDTTSANPFDQWPHPHLNPLVGQFDIQIDNDIPRLASIEPDIQAKLDNFDSLINLSKRWSRQYRIQTKRVENKLRGHRRKHRIVFNDDTLREKLETWHDEAKDECGLKAYALLESSVLAVSLIEGSDLFIEFYTYATS
jgi:hypothetical protein